MMRRLYFFAKPFACSFVLFSIITTPSIAAPIVPPTPGAVQDTVQDRRSPDVASPAQIVFTADDVEGSPDQPDSAKRFLVSGFTFTGNTAFSEFELRNITEQYLDLQLTLQEIDRIAAKIT